MVGRDPAHDGRVVGPGHTGTLWCHLGYQVSRVFILIRLENDV
jgi:hypothetical protein